jgi:1-acyl-sn-glycerol-3-phosphate acyltransferase
MELQHVVEDNQMKTAFVDRKSWFMVVFWYLVNKIVTRFKYRNFNVIGAENIPASGSFLLISNHTSRWDGLVLMETIKRSANWMVSPNELKGFQGVCLRSVGAFPAISRFELLKCVERRIGKGEPLVIFPEGNIFTDGATHRFKSGAARVLLTAKEKGLDMPVICVAIQYVDEHSVNIVVSKPFHADHTGLELIEDHPQRVRTLTDVLHSKLSSERRTLESGDFVRQLENVS